MMSSRVNSNGNRVLPSRFYCPMKHNNFELAPTPKICCQCECQGITFICKTCKYMICQSCCEGGILHENICSSPNFTYYEMSEKDRNSDLDFRRRRFTCIKCKDQSMALYVKCNSCPWIYCNSCFKDQQEQKRIQQQERQQQAPESDMCKVCMAQRATFLNQNCGHLSVCRADAGRLDKCPICRTQGRFIQLYTS